MPKTSGSLTYGFTEADVGLQAFLRDGRNDPRRNATPLGRAVPPCVRQASVGIRAQ